MASNFLSPFSSRNPVLDLTPVDGVDATLAEGIRDVILGVQAAHQLLQHGGEKGLQQRLGGGVLRLVPINSVKTKTYFQVKTELKSVNKEKPSQLFYLPNPTSQNKYLEVPGTGTGSVYL